MTTHPAVVATLFVGVGLAMSLVVLALVAMLSGAATIGVGLAVAAVLVGGATRFVSEVASRSVARA